MGSKLRSIGTRVRVVWRPVPVFNQRYPRVELFEWLPNGGAANFGDHLAKVVASKIVSDAGYTPDQEVSHARRLFSVGSVIHFANNGDVIWGSGINGKIPSDRYKFGRLDVRSVRGPMTANYLRERGIKVPDIFGDPALLIPTLFPQRFKVEPIRKVLFIPNLHDLSHISTHLPSVSPLRGWNHVVEMIVGSELVVSSSLHGIVIAEAFGIPARYVRLSGAESPFKYDDYAQGTGRDALEPAQSIAQAIEMGGMPRARFDPQSILEAFPLDLWSGVYAPA